MVRAWSAVLGIGLILLGVAGFYTPSGTWIAWLDMAGGLISLLVASIVSGGTVPVSAEGAVRSQPYTHAGAILLICLGLFVVWIVGLTTKSVTATMAWWNFGFACAYGLLAIGAYSGRGRAVRPQSPRQAA